MFAQISLDKLEPDLVIMDEFQRFKYLIHSDPDTETGMLAAKFFNAASVRMLLLSATPYKMYSTLEEIDENDGSEEHYKEFMDVMAFSQQSKQLKMHFTAISVGPSGSPQPKAQISLTHTKSKNPWRLLPPISNPICRRKNYWKIFICLTLFPSTISNPVLIFSRS